MAAPCTCGKDASSRQRGTCLCCVAQRAAVTCISATARPCARPPGGTQITQSHTMALAPGSEVAQKCREAPGPSVPLRCPMSQPQVPFRSYGQSPSEHAGVPLSPCLLPGWPQTLESRPLEKARASSSLGGTQSPSSHLSGLKGTPYLPLSFPT